ncbi:L-dehydroascorbate transporter large permease subunit [Marinomonas sp. CT5]|uniref:TRAP transporter large permease subunit n=1 Tax=Marinomonas sp. CT5 TaxID=2066133 RepID=UPI00180B1E35|nr:TRAP transporter large permease subunit [Marinomonas sp. CT5]NVK74321.1 TRAP transporter large permease subunit [Oceanospirillaceae bacterium]QUX94570.1 L-dehydroascorbate transporter large permease subunit [Marinomonas sp. CT5]
MALGIFLLSLAGFMFLGMPIAFALILTGVTLMWHLDFFDAQLIAQNLINGADSFPLMAVPFFILAGEVMNAGGISKRIINLAISCVGHRRGGLGYVAIIAAVILASLSGSAIADTAALATLLLPMMRNNGYPIGRSAGLIAAGGIIAPIIPPSMPFIIFGVTANLSISKLFMAGIVPGIIMGLGLVLAWKWSMKTVDVEPQPRQSIKARLSVAKDGFFALLMPVIIIGGLRGGLFTPTEAAVIAAGYAMIISLLVYRELKIPDLIPLFIQAAYTTSIVMFLCAAAIVSSYMVTLADLPAELINILAPVMDSPRILMATIVIVMLLIGMVMDLTPTILILAPVTIPLIIKAGIDPIYFGVMFIMVGCVGLITPPVGTVLSVVSSVAREPLEKITRGILPFLLAYMAIIVLFVVFPEIITVPAKLLY